VATKRMVLKYSVFFLAKQCLVFLQNNCKKKKRPEFWFLRIEERKGKKKSMSTCIAKFHSKAFLLRCITTSFVDDDASNYS
jgi:hypothetical protein